MTGPFDEVMAKLQPPAQAGALGASGAAAPPAGPFDHIISQLQPESEVGANTPLSTPTEPVGPLWSSAPGRFVQGMGAPILGAGQLLSHATGIGTEYADRKVREGEEMRQASRQEAGMTPQSWDIARGIGEMVSPINLLPAARAAKALTAAPTLLGAAGRGALQGGLFGATTAVDSDKAQENFAREKLKQIGVGTAAGAVAGPALEGLAKVAVPAISENARMMYEKGSKPIIGGMLGPLAQRLEGSGASFPFSGNMIRERMLDSFKANQQALADNALSDIGSALPTGAGRPEPGFETTKYLGAEMGKNFDRLFGSINLARDTAYTRSLTRVKDAADKFLPKEAKKTFDQEIKEFSGDVHALVGRTRGAGAPLTGSEVQTMLSNLKNRERSFAQSQLPMDQKIGRYLKQYREAITQAVEHQNPGFKDKYNDASVGYIKYLIMEQAGKDPSGWAMEGVPNPTQYARAVYKVDKSLRKGAAAKGEAMMQKWASAAKDVLPNKVPDSGTPERSAILALFAGHNPYTYPGLIAGLAGIPLLYNRPVQSMLRSAIANPTMAQRGIAGASRQLQPWAPQTLLESSRQEPRQ